MKKNANLANKRNRRRNALTWPLAALLGAALFALPTDAAKADDFGFSLNLGCFSLNIGNNDDCCDHAPPIVVAPPKPAPRPIVVAPPRGKTLGKGPQIAARPTPPRPAVVRGQAPGPRR